MAKGKTSTKKRGGRLKAAVHRGCKGIDALLSAALAIPGLALTAGSTSAQTPTGGTVSLQYWDYLDAQRSGNRIKVRSPILYFNIPTSERDTLTGSLIYDTVSGASPYYLSALSGASGKGIYDARTAGDLKFTHTFDRFSVGIAGNGSTENDYDSVGGNIETKIWTEDKNTTFALAGGLNSDHISSSIDANLHEARNGENFLLGVTQVVTPEAIVQSNLTYTTGTGYFSDPYKPLDNRPRSREQWAWLTRYNQYISPLDASLHLDYRLYNDSFHILSHTVEASLYQPISETWMLRPSVRYYTQSKASFFQGSFPPDGTNQYFSADQRLSAFGGVSAGLKAIKDFGGGYSAQISGDYMMQQQDFRPGSNGSSLIEPFHAWFWSLGITKKF